jgi:hypothetical protein
VIAHEIVGKQAAALAHYLSIAEDLRERSGAG